MTPTHPVSPVTDKLLHDRMERLGIREVDLEEKFIKGSGPGGQKINKTSSCVFLVHRPTGIEVKCQRTRSQALNRFYARRELCDTLEERIEGEKSKREMEREKIRRQKRKRSKRQREKMLAEKRHRGAVKTGRARVRNHSESDS